MGVHVRPLVIGFTTEQQALLAAIETHTTTEARILWDDADAGPGGDWSALLPHAGKHFQARALTPVTALAFEGEQLLAAFKQDPQFGMAFMLRLMVVVSERLRAARVQLIDMYLPEAKRAGT